MKANAVIAKVQEKIAKANEELNKIVSGGFPFTFDEVKITVDTDSAGIYVRSGRTPVCVVARFGDPLMVLREIEGEISNVVSSTRTAVERRGKLKAEHDELAKADEEIEAAKKALTAQNLPVGLLGQVDKEISEAIVAAARKAVKEANRGLYLMYGRAIDAMGGLEAAKLRVHGYAGGLVVTANNNACIVSRFPKSKSNKTIEKMVAFISAEVAALSESRRDYMAYLEKMLLHEEQLHLIANKFDEANAMLAACK